MNTIKQLLTTGKCAAIACTVALVIGGCDPYAGMSPEEIERARKVEKAERAETKRAEQIEFVQKCLNDIAKIAYEIDNYYPHKLWQANKISDTFVKKYDELQKLQTAKTDTWETYFEFWGHCDETRTSLKKLTR